MKRSLAIKLSIGLLLLALVGFLVFRGGDKSQEKSFGVVERRDLVQRVTIAGSITPKRRTVVSAPYSGYVKQVFVAVGDQVKPGQPLVSITQSLQSSEPVFPLRAPYAGTVVHVQKQEGENVKADDTVDYLMRIDDLSKFFVNANAPEIDRAKLRKGQETVIKASALPDRPYKGVITELTLAPKDSGGRNQQEYPVRIEVLDKDELLGPGMSVVIDIITGKKEKVLTLRLEYVQRDEENQYYVILASGERRNIKTGMQNEEAFEIVDGLKESDKVQLIDFSSAVK